MRWVTLSPEFEGAWKKDFLLAVELLTPFELRVRVCSSNKTNTTNKNLFKYYYIIILSTDIYSFHCNNKKHNKYIETIHFPHMTGTKWIALCVCIIWLCKYFESESKSDSCLFLYLYCECCWIITTTKTATTTIRSDLQRLSTGSVRQLDLSTLSSYTHSLSLCVYLRNSV